MCVFYHKSEDVEYLQGDTKRLHAFMLRAAIRRMIVCWRFNGGNWYFQTPMPILKKTDNNLHCLHWAEIRPPQMVSFCKISLVFSFFLLAILTLQGKSRPTPASRKGQREASKESSRQKLANAKDFFNTFTFHILTLCLFRLPISICLIKGSNCTEICYTTIH